MFAAAVYSQPLPDVVGWTHFIFIAVGYFEFISEVSQCPYLDFTPVTQ